MRYFSHSLVLIALIIVFLNSSCEKKHKLVHEQQQSYYSNIEGNNQTEGQHIFIERIHGDTLFLKNNISAILKSINYNWCIGQGSGKPYYDTGKEKIWYIKKILPLKNAVVTFESKIKLAVNKPIVFWKKGHRAQNFTNDLKGSYGFSSIVYDSTKMKFYTHLHECDNEKVNIYNASSNDLLNWDIVLGLTPKDFKAVSWNKPLRNKKLTATPMPSEVILFEGKYYHFMYADDEELYSRIGLMTSENFEGPYQIKQTALVEPNPNSQFSNKDVYHPKVIFYNGSWWMFYTSKNEEKDEFISLAQSSNLTKWKVVKENIIKRNDGWNNGLKNQMVAQVKVKNDSLYLWTTGIKKLGDFENLNKGNVMDQCIGKFACTDTNFNFEELPGNPIFCGNPTSENENDHIGAAFQEVFYNNYNFTFYHAKGRNNRNYTILIK